MLLFDERNSPVDTGTESAGNADPAGLKDTYDPENIHEPPLEAEKDAARQMEIQKRVSEEDDLNIPSDKSAQEGNFYSRTGEGKSMEELDEDLNIE